MKKILGLFCICLMALSANAEEWYTFQIKGGLYISYPGAANTKITLDRMTTTYSDADLWRREGDNTNGYRVYNKAAGTDMVLAAPTNTSDGNTGGNTYAVMVDANNVPSGYTDLWQFAESSDVEIDDEKGFYMYEKGSTSNKLNNRNGVLAFWTSGADAGSTVHFILATKEVEVSVSKGSYTSSNAGKTWHSAWQSTDADPVAVIFQSNANNMQSSGDNFDIRSGQAKSATYTFRTSGTKYFVSGYRFDAKLIGTEQVLTYNGNTLNVTSTSTRVEASDLEDGDATFTLTGPNTGTLIENVVVTLQKSAEQEDTTRYEVFITTGSPNYRIPAIATTQSGKLIAVADYRYGGADIGYGSVELRRSLSSDNGKTWGEIVEFTHGEYASSPQPKYDAAYGDPCIVADRESRRAMIISCSGNTGFPNGTRSVHQGIARFYSTDDGETWSEPVNLESQFYSLLDNSTRGPIKSMFIGSGRIFQSHQTKKGDYYRLYCSGLVKDKNGSNINYVYYSDDFGENWTVLGDINTPPITSGDEPKAEELPDGSILCSSRISGGRRFNIFTFTDKDNDEGSWGTEAASNSSNNGVIGPGCNGEIMIVPVVRNSDGEKMNLALHTSPANASSRTNVSLFYKPLTGKSDYSTPAVFAKNWTKYQLSKIGSAYSTMTLMANNHIGVLYEESTYGKDYTIVFKDVSLEQLTDSAYSYDGEAREIELSLMSSTADATSAVLTFNKDLTLNQTTVQLNDNVTATASVSGAKLTLTYDEQGVGKHTLVVPAGVVTDGTTENEEVTLTFRVLPSEVLPLGDTVKKLSEISEDKTYVLYNPHFTAKAIYAPKYSESSVWCGEMIGDSGHALSNETYGEEVNPVDPNCAWMLIKYDSKYYLYNVGAEMLLKVGSNGGTRQATFTTESSNVAVKQLTDGLAFNTAGGDTDYMCASPQLGNPIAVWTSDDSGSTWQFIENPNVEADLATAMTIIDPTATGIATVTENGVEKGIFDLEGRKINGFLPRRGVYVVNGKKILK